MPPPLRKACHACFAAKRGCRPELPKCSRCAEKGLECTYDLEPVTNLNSSSGPPSLDPSFPRQDQDHLHAVRQPLPTVMYDSIPSAEAAVIQSYGSDSPAGLPAVSDPETFALGFEHLGRIPLWTFQHRSTPFVHAQVLSTATQAGVPLIEASPGGGVLPSELLEKEQRRLLALDPHVYRWPLKDFLAVFHELLAILVASFSSKFSNKIGGATPEVLALDVQALGELFSKWSAYFYQALPRSLDDDALSPWQAWVLAESIRRTLIAILTIQVLQEIAQRGYFHYRPMVESLPLDARTGLWEADTEQDWQAAVARHGGAECSLVSWHEFIERAEGPEPRAQYDGMLQRLLLVGYFGKAAAERANQEHEDRQPLTNLTV